MAGFDCVYWDPARWVYHYRLEFRQIGGTLVDPLEFIGKGMFPIVYHSIAYGVACTTLQYDRFRI